MVSNRNPCTKFKGGGGVPNINTRKLPDYKYISCHFFDEGVGGGGGSKIFLQNYRDLNVRIRTYLAMSAPWSIEFDKDEFISVNNILKVGLC